jgi:hypothetical protein
LFPISLFFGLPLFLNSNVFLLTTMISRRKTTTVVLPSTTSTAPVGVSQEETVVENPSHDILEKIVGAPPTKRCICFS